MITLDTQNRSLEIVLSSPVDINEFPVIVAFSSSANNIESFRCQISQTNGIIPVNILQAPKTKVQLLVLQITIQNKDTSNNTITLRFNNNSVIKDIVKVLLQPLDTLFYEDGFSFSVLDRNGRNSINVGSPTSVIAE